MKDEFLAALYDEHQMCRECPKPEEVDAFFKRVLGLLFKDYSTKELQSISDIEVELSEIRTDLTKIVEHSPKMEGVRNQEIVDTFFNSLPPIYKLLKQDIDAIYDGDPAANSKYEIIRSYPGFYAVAAYRLAHILHTSGLKEIPRIITEHAHTDTGIDIHPGAQIGEHFCIDHGTGVVIGETTVIGNHVKIYQGVTLGALSVRKEDAHVKRHPTLEDHTVIYAGATILGGNTVIGHHSIIGGNVWITRSVEPYSKIYYQSKMNYGDDVMDTVVFKKFDV